MTISALGFPIINWFGSGDESLGFIYLGVCSGLAAIFILTITVKTVRERNFNLEITQLPKFSEVSKSIVNNYAFLIVFASTLTLITTSIMFNKNLIYYTKYALDLHEHQGLILGVSSASAFLAIPVWAYSALKIGKRNSWLISMILLVFSFLFFYFYPIKNLLELLTVLAVLGIGNGATGVLFWSMLPDTIEYGEWKTGVRTESSLYGFMTFAQKGGIAISALILGVLLTNIGFVPNTIQTEETLENLKTLMTFIPLSGVVLSFMLVYFYPVDSKFHRKLIREINERG